MPSIEADERLRLADLETYAVLDTPPEDVFDRLTRLAAVICETPFATMTLIDERRQWFKSRVGLEVAATDRTHAFCAVCIAKGSALVVPDAKRDPEFASNPFVTGPPFLRFYAGVPLISAAGHALGTVAVMDLKPRQLSAMQLETLEVLARQTMLELELRRDRLQREALGEPAVAGRVRSTGDSIAHAANDATDQDAQAARQRDLQTQIGIVQLQQEIASSSMSLQAVLDLMAERACEFVGGAGAQLVFVERAGLVCRAASGSMQGTLNRQLAAGRSLSAHAMQSGEALVSVDTQHDDRVDAETCRLTGTLSLAVAPLSEDHQVVGALVVGAGETHAFSERDLVNLQMLAESLGAAIQRHRIAEQLRVSEEQYRLLFDRNPHPMWVYETDGLRFLAVNRKAVEHYGYSESEFLAMRVTELWAGDTGPMAWQLPGGEGRATRYVGRRRHHKRDGSEIEVEVLADAIDFNGRPARLVIATDVTARINADRELARINRAQRMLRACSETLARGEDEIALLQAICRISVEIGGYRMAWVGYAQDDAEQSVQPMAWAGEATEYLKEVRPSWSADSAHGRVAIGVSIREARTVIVPEIQLDIEARPWSPRTLEYGLRSAVCLPLVSNQRSFGVLCLYMGEVAQLPPDEVQLLEALAKDLAFGIRHVRAQEDQKRAQTAVLKVAAAVSTVSGKEFFQHLALHAADALGASASFVSRMLPGQPLRARTIAAICDGKPIDNFDYEIASTPCSLLDDADHVVIEQQVGARFPDYLALKLFNTQAYVGLRLDNSAGERLGQLTVLFRQPLTDAEIVVPTLRIFAARIAGEMERQDSDVQIRHQASLLDQAQDAIIVRSIDHRVVYWNRSAARMYGFSAAEAMGRSVAGLLHEDASAFTEATNVVLANDEWRGEIQQRCKDGSSIQVEGHWTLVRDEDGHPQSILSINTDITQRKAAERRIHTLAFYDLLTGLPNRLMLADQLEQALATSAHSGMGGALLFIDLDNFKTLNDTLGHERGDRMLEEVAARLTKAVRGVDTVARLGGDEFVVMLEALSEEPAELVSQARSAGEKLLTTLSAPYRLGSDHVHQSTASIGVAVFNGLRDSVGELLKQADIAMYQAKGAGRNTLRFFDPGLQAALTARAAFEADLRLALVEHQLCLYYQPQAEGPGRVTGAEALVRWRHPQRGLVSPAEFIPLAEETGLIVQLGRAVLREACAMLASWAGQPLTEDLSMSVNVSASQFRHPDFVSHVTTELDRSGANPRRLKIELTESLMVDDVDVTITKMAALKMRGVSFSLDDFGTGYSSLSYLKRLPLDQLKIDQSFVRDIMADANDTAIVQTIIALGRSLGLGVIAEGVETEGQRDFLAQHGCTAYQGYLFSRPLPADQLGAFIQSRAEAVQLSP